MKNGEISNKQAPYVLFDIDSLLFKEAEEKKVMDKVKDVFKTMERKKVEQEFNRFFVKRLERIWMNHNVCIGLVTFDINKERFELEKRLMDENVPYTRLFLFEDWNQLREADSIYTVSNNEDLLSFLSQNHAIHYSQLGEILK